MNTISLKYLWFLKIIFLNIAAYAFIYLTPTFSHLINFPLYLFDPMRIVLFFVIFTSNKKNALWIALTLPIFSSLISGHPYHWKAVLIVAELIINTLLFYKLLTYFKNAFWSTSISIVISKIIYYSLKYLFIYLLLIKSSLFSTPFYYQIITILFLSLLCYLFYKKRSNNNNQD